ncbi:anhydro-N-acetylmuramic acid kinase [Xanthomarina sp. F2636L]|uniref:anhydro-N-acetylmuramic acid kinase n=1 Tax=Xanthomarina sp. F2636L TaxID=2996018 RepID=UPI00225E4F18|nr:anhydro-N-acetylmuramic acid kinase [Xanthomarina sp. F2636L]MCX7551937.1 anhydro-N-acetylmuramic acid kinase [Xanthomarina sp. F2636L]
MNKTEYRIVGVMSGTSLDGVDLVYVTFTINKGVWKYKIHASRTQAYTKEWYDVLKHLVLKSVDELQEIDREYSQYLAKIIQDFIAENKIQNLDAISSHGHTALHQPEKGMTYQIGNLPSIYKFLKTPIVCNFRVQDVALGGQGAPLVPIGDRLLFSNYDFCLNLGGFANISTEIETHRIAYDICPVNIVLNHYASLIGLEYDDKGKIASTGALNQELLDQLNCLEFYKKQAPKSLGLEWVNKEIFPIINGFQLPVETVLRTFVEHVAIQISNEINKKNHANVLITGGGAYHTFLIKTIQEKTSHTLIIPENVLVEFKEALVFGFLGVLKLREEVNCLRSVTGAKHDHSSGIIFND